MEAGSEGELEADVRRNQREMFGGGGPPGTKPISFLKREIATDVGS